MLMTFEELEQIRQKYNEKRKALFRSLLIPYAIILSFIVGTNLLTIAKSGEVDLLTLVIMAPFVVITSALPITVILTIIYVIINVSKNTDYEKEYRNAYKNYFVSSTMKKIFTDLTYSHKSSMPYGEISKTGIMRMGDCYSSNDYCTAKYKGANFKQADVHLQEEHTDSDGDRTYVTIFRGRYIIFDFDKTIQKRLVVAGKSFRNEKIDKNFERIKLESSEFNKTFDVFAEDGFEAFYILNPAVMERIMKLSNIHNNQIMLAFYKGEMHIAINNNIDSFEPARPTKPIDEKAEFNKVINDLKVITNIVDEMKLAK